MFASTTRVPNHLNPFRMAEYRNFKRPNMSRPRPFSAQAGGSRELFDAQCNKCSARCQVPFRPNGKKPVYCANCFVKDDQRAESRGAKSLA